MSEETGSAAEKAAFAASYSGSSCDCKQEGSGAASTEDVAGVDLSSVKSMKAYLKEQNVSSEGIFSKEDLVQLVKDTAKKAKAPAAGKPLLRTQAVGPLACNMSILADPKTMEAVLVDPGGDAAVILELVKTMKVKVVQILITHAHFDHFLAATEVRKALNAPVYLNANDLTLWRALPMQCMLIGMRNPPPAPADPEHSLEDGTKLKVLDGKAIHTPGHSPGSSCFYFASQKLLFSGDTLFRGSIGRTDLMGGDMNAITMSIQEKLYSLPEDTDVIPGHGEHTTIGFEKKNNMIVRAKI